MVDFDVMMNPEKHGYKECPHCNGYGSSLKDPIGVDTCTRCGGSGIVKKEKMKARLTNLKSEEL